MSHGQGTCGARLVEVLSSETKKEPNKWTVSVGEVVRKAYSYMSTEPQMLRNKVGRHIMRVQIAFFGYIY